MNSLIERQRGVEVASILGIADEPLTYFAEVTHNQKTFVIEYRSEALLQRDAKKPCGNGTWIYNKKTNTLGRWSITFSHDLPCNDRPFGDKNIWNPKREWHLVVGTTSPLWVWWGDGKGRSGDPCFVNEKEPWNKSPIPKIEL